MADNALTRDPRQFSIGPTPRNALLGFVADNLKKANDFAQVPDPVYPGRKGRETLSYIASALGLGDLAAVADRASFGLPMTQGTGFARQMVPEARNALAGMVPGMIAKPAAVGKMALSAMGAMDTGAMSKAALVWHGSPHKFDKFDSSKIGTGEGAQAYGHGLYLAESPDVAGAYAALNKTSSPSSAAFIRLRDKAPAGSAEWNHYDALANEGVSNLYKVDLPDPMIARMLDWDKPLSQQAPDVVDAARKAFPPSYVDGRFVDPFASGKTGRALLDEMTAIANKRGAPGMRMAEPALRAAGIPGIRYLDGGSRGAGAGTSNFVVFPGEENALTILQRNGQQVRR